MTLVHETGRAVLVLRDCHFGSESREGEASGPCVRMYPFGRRTSRPCRPASPSRILPSCHGFVGELANSVAAAAARLVLAAWAAATGTTVAGPLRRGAVQARRQGVAPGERGAGIGRAAMAVRRHRAPRRCGCALLAVQRWTRHGGDRARRRCRRCRTTLPCAFIPALWHGAARSERCVMFLEAGSISGHRRHMRAVRSRAAACCGRVVPA